MSDVFKNKLGKGGHLEWGVRKEPVITDMSWRIYILGEEHIYKFGHVLSDFVKLNGTIRS